MSFKKIDCNLTQKFSEYPDFGVLNGVKVFVSGTAIAGPFAGCLMAEMGAKVLQSEAPKISCGTRGTTSWSQNHRNEYSITCNPRTPAGKKIFKKCLEWADIWIESSKAGTYAKMGLTDEVCWGVNSKLCIVHVSGYGQTGPYKSKASYDVSGQAMGGYMYMNGVSPTDVPLKVNPYLSDYVTAYNACMTALSAYIHALKTGKGESCDVAQYDTMFRLLAEVTLAVHFREKNKDGDYVGGPMYYIKNGLKKHWQWLAYLFSAFGVLTVFGTGNATQVNTITTAIDSALFNYNVISEDQVSTLNLIIGIVLAILIALILLGGIKRIGQVTEKLVPFMAVMYIVLAIGVVLLNVKNVPTVFASIFEGAFNPASVTGGVVGSFFMSMKKGVSRGIFSNEAGLGTGSIAHACADTRKPVKQGFFGIFEVFVDTIVICTLTALVILCSKVPIGYGEAAGAELTISGFTATYGGWVSIFTAIAMCCFAFSTIIGWGLYGVRCIEFLFGTRVNKPFMLVYSLVAIVGATMNLGLLWSIAETFNGLMVIPNLIAVFLLSGVVVKMVKDYFNGIETY